MRKKRAPKLAALGCLLVRSRGLELRPLEEVMRFPFARALAFALLSSAFAASIANANLGEVNVYSYRQPYLIDPLFKEFTDETGIKVNVIFAEKGLIERIRPN